MANNASGDDSDPESADDAADAPPGVRSAEPARQALGRESQLERLRANKAKGNS